MSINNTYLNKFEQSISRLCKAYNVYSLSAFGSVLTGKFNEESDIDLLVDFLIDESDRNYLKNMIQLKMAFQNLFNRHVDLLSNDMIKNPVVRNGFEKKQLLLFRVNQSELISHKKIVLLLQ